MIAVLLLSVAGAQADARALPAADSPPVVRSVDVAFPSAPNGPFIDPETYLYYIRTKASRPSDGEWVLFDPRGIADDVKRLWDTAFLEDISVDVTDEPYENGIVGKHIVFRLEERRRVRIIDYAGSKALAPNDINHKLAELNAQISIDSLVDAGRIKRVEDVVRDLLRERGHPFATISHRVTDISGTSFVRLTFTVDDGPHVKARDTSQDAQASIAWRRHKIQRVVFEGNHAASTDILHRFFGLELGASYDDNKIRRGFERASEWYGARGYYDFSGYPDVQAEPGGAALVDVTIRITEGDQYFIHRIALKGNTLTHDAVARRELGLREGDLFSTEAIKATVRRLNQLALFQPLTERDVRVEKASDPGRLVDVTFDVKEQKQDNVNFGGGVSQAEGVFGNISYVTPNFLGRGQRLTFTADQGSRGRVYRTTLTEPYLWGGPWNGSIGVFGGRTSYDTVTTPNAYSEARKGLSLSFGTSVSPFARVNFGYTYEIDDVGIDATLLGTALSNAGAPALSGSDLGRHVDGRVSLGIVHDTIDNAFMPHDGVRLSAGMQLASRALGGDFNYVKPEAEAVWYHSTGRHTGVGLRAQAGAIETYGATTDVPYSMKYELGGENQIRGVDLRTVGPLDANGRVLGGTRFTLFNADYHVDLTSRIRVLVFGDAGQAFDAAHPFDLGDLRTSTGVELRVVLPFIHLPVRFIYYWNPSRDSFQTSQGFRISIGTSF